MKEAKFTQVDANRIDELREKALKDIIKNPICRKFIEKYDISEDEIKKNSSKFLKVIEDHKICEKCPGLDNCTKGFKGININLDIDEDTDEITIKYDPCEEGFQSLTLDSQYLIRDFPDSFLHYDKRELLDNPDYLTIRAPILTYLAKNYDSNGIYLTGPRMTGKSFILAIYSKIFIENGKGQVAFVDAPSEFKYINDLNFSSKESYNRRMRDLMNVDLLILDDFGNEYKSEFIRDTIVYPILNERLKNGKLTWFTSSYSLDEINQMYSLKERFSPKAKQLVDVIKTMTKEYQLGGLKFRK